MTRQTRGRAVLAALLCAVMIGAAACSTAWIGDAEQIVAALVPAVSNVLALVAALQGKSVTAQDAQSIQNAAAQAGSDLQLIQSLITQYKNAETSAQPAILGQLATAIAATQENLNGILPALHIEDPATREKITAVVAIVQSEVSSLAALVPMIGAKASAEGDVMAMAAVKRKPPLAASEFIHSYNATITAKTGSAELDRATSGLKIHLHGRLARWATAGWLK